jgi:hypothetical protein
MKLAASFVRLPVLHMRNMVCSGETLSFRSSRKIFMLAVPSLLKKVERILPNITPVCFHSSSRLMSTTTAFCPVMLSWVTSISISLACTTLR